jgi:hypothetical protein
MARGAAGRAGQSLQPRHHTLVAVVDVVEGGTLVVGTGTPAVFHRALSSCVTLVLAAAALRAQAAPQPLNGSVSDFGTTFVFSPGPICRRCFEAELGIASVADDRSLPAVLTWAPFDRTDFSLLANLAESSAPSGKRTTHLGDRVDLVVRRKVFDSNGFLLSVAPRGTIDLRDDRGGRAGGTIAGQYAKGNGILVGNLTLTGGVVSSPVNPRLDYQASFDFFRALDHRGTAVFVGFQHEASTANHPQWSTEEAVVLPFPDGQVELATQQVSLNLQLAWQVQARVVLLLRK